MFKHILSKKGFTIIEIIVTLAILGIIIMPIMSTILTGYKINRIGEIEYRSTMLAQKYMERVKSWKTLNTADIKEYSGDIDGFKTRLSLEKVDSFDNNQVVKASSMYDLFINRNAGFIIFKNKDIILKQISDEDEFDIIINDTNLVIGGETIAFSFTSLEPKIGIEIDKNIKINIRNNTDKKVYIDIIENDLSTYVCDINVISGQITKRTNIIEKSYTKSAEGILYKVIIKVTYEGKEVYELIGYKVFN